MTGSDETDELSAHDRQLPPEAAAVQIAVVLVYIIQKPRVLAEAQCAAT